MKRIDLCGNRFGRLTVEEYLGNCYYLCKCDCGNYKKVFSGNLTNGDIKSCGCLRKEVTGNLKKRHGGKGTRLYGVWKGMRQRCLNSSNSAYSLYGGRGIKICEEWNDFEKFKEWSYENGYKENLSIDRIDVNGNYEPSNCRWATQNEQANNQRRNVKIPFKGEMKTAAEWSKEKGVCAATIRWRFHHGYDESRLFEPTKNIFRNAYEGGDHITP